MPDSRQSDARTRIVQIDGKVWTVQEHRSRTASRDQRSLVFQRDGVARRVHEFPDDWYSLADTELEALSWRR